MSGQSRCSVGTGSRKEDEHRIIYLKSWNEWGEGNYVEPDEEFGPGLLDALRDAQK